MNRTRRSLVTGLILGSLPWVSGKSSASQRSRYSGVVIAKNPVGFWRLGEQTGPVALDSSGGGHHGSYHGTLAFAQQGAIRHDMNTAVAFDGASYVEIPSHPVFSQTFSGNGLSVEAWLRPDALEFRGETADPYVHWLGKGDQGQYEWALRFYSRASHDRPNRISAYLFNADGGLGAGAYFEDRIERGQWIHVVACFDPGSADRSGAGVHIYKDGMVRSGPPSRGTLYNNPKWKIDPRQGNAPVRLGTRDQRSFLVGALDEVAIYPRVLSAAEVRANFMAGQGY